MARSHPPTLTTLVKATLRERDVLPRGSTVLVAVSGGPDSMALLHILAGLRREAGYGLFAHGIDHGLRIESAQELDVVLNFAHALDVPFERTRLRIAPGANLQARARAARWSALREAAGRAGASRIATGHHADDRAETFVMRLLRGTRARTLGVLPAREGDRIRPMIRARRSDVEAHVARHAIPHSVDPSNRDPRFLRTRVRYEILPLLERLGPGVVEHMCAIADELDASAHGNAGGGVRGGSDAPPLRWQRGGRTHTDRADCGPSAAHSAERATKR